MSCNICFENFDEEERRPKILQCGHTYCITCLFQICGTKTEILCPEDKKKVPVGDPRRLPDNYSLQCLIADSRRSAPKFFCLDCNQDAEPKCVEEHVIYSLKKVRLQKVEDRLPSMKEGCGSVILPKLIQQLDRAERRSGPPELQFQKAFLLDKNKRAQAAVGSFYKALDASGPGWEDALKLLEEECKAMSPMVATLEDAVDVLNIDGPTVLVGSARGGAWSGQLQLTEKELNLLRCLLFQQRMAGNLARVDQGQEGQPDKILLPPRCETSPMAVEAEDELDLSHFHDEFGFTNNSEQLRQLLESKKKVRVLRGLGAYDPARAAADEATRAASIQQSISRALDAHAPCLEEVTLRTRCRSHLRQVLGLKALRKLDVTYADWRCPCGHCQADEARADVTFDTISRCPLQIVVLDVPKEWFAAVLKCSQASLREVVIRNVPVPKDVSSAVYSYSNWRWLPPGVWECSLLQSFTLFRPERCAGGSPCATQLTTLTDLHGGSLTARCGSCQQTRPRV